MKTTAMPEFITRSFKIGECKYKVAITLELNPITLQPTGAFIGTFLSSVRGTGNFKFHKDKVERVSNLDLLYPGVTNELYNIIQSLKNIEVGYAETFVPTAIDHELPYEFSISVFTYREIIYKVAITPRLVAGIYDLDHTGIFIVTLISSEEGTKQFELIPDDHLRLMPGSKVKGMDTGLINEIVKLIEFQIK